MVRIGPFDFARFADGTVRVTPVPDREFTGFFTQDEAAQLVNFLDATAGMLPHVQEQIRDEAIAESDKAIIDAAQKQREVIA